MTLGSPHETWRSVNERLSRPAIDRALLFIFSYLKTPAFLPGRTSPAADGDEPNRPRVPAALVSIMITRVRVNFTWVFNRVAR